MNVNKFLAMFAIGGILFMSCSDDDDNPTPVNEEELITTITITLTAGSDVITLKSFDEDGADGPTAPMVTVSGDLTANTTYNGAIMLLNESESPAEVVNKEIEAESDEHQFFYEVGSGLAVSTGYSDTENDYLQNGGTNPVGIEFELVTAAASTGTFTVTLRHMPKKPNDGTLVDAGGDTDITQSFNLTIQ